MAPQAVGSMSSLPIDHAGSLGFVLDLRPPFSVHHELVLFEEREVAILKMKLFKMGATEGRLPPPSSPVGLGRGLAAQARTKGRLRVRGNDWDTHPGTDWAGRSDVSGSLDRALPNVGVNPRSRHWTGPNHPSTRRMLPGAESLPLTGSGDPTPPIARSRRPSPRSGPRIGPLLSRRMLFGGWLAANPRASSLVVSGEFLPNSIRPDG